MNKRIPILLGLLIMGITIWSLVTPSRFMQGLITRLENLGYDIQLRTRVFTENLSPNKYIAIIDIDDKSLQTEGRWPWSRKKIAELTQQLQKQGAAVIAFDILFAEKEDNIVDTLEKELTQKKLLDASLETLLKKYQPNFDQDAKFALGLSNSQAVLAISFLPHLQIENELPPPLLHLTKQEIKQYNIIQAKGYISNIPQLQKSAKGGGFINIFADSDGIIRRAPLLMEYQEGLYPLLSLQAVLLFLAQDIKLVTVPYHDEKKIEGIQLGNYIIPTDERTEVIIPYIGKSYTFPYYSASDVLHNKIPNDALAGKILFVGTSATGLGDLQATSIQSPFPGVEIQATIANGLLINKFSYIPEWTVGANFFLIFLFGSLAACFFPYLGPRILVSIIILLPSGLLILNNWIWIKTGLILSLFIPVLLILMIAILNIIYGYLFETKRRERLKEMFGQYVPESHIDEMLKTSSSLALLGEDREMSVLFADIRNFTTVSEDMHASELVDMLNTFFTPMTEIIFKNQGTIDKYVGDLLMAFWGAPLKDKHHAYHAIESAIEMKQMLTQLHKTFTKRNWPLIDIGIGVNSGMMSVGDMGSRYRRNYTVLGDTVNLASRVEELNKFYGTNIITTQHSIVNQTKFIFRQLDKVKVKGKLNSIEIFEIIDFKKNMTEEINQELALHQQALDFYFMQRWEEAYPLFQKLHERYPEKKLYSIYIDRILEFKQHPPKGDWNGVFIHTSK